MKRLSANITDQAWRHRMGRRFEAFTEEAFHVIRWSLMVGLARYLSVTAHGRAYDVIHWALAALLFGYIASRLLLRPEIPLVPEAAPTWQRLLQSAVNFLVCVGAFAILLWGINTLADGVAHYRFAPMGQ
jgi:predicted cobalt transporter CbtA